MLSARARAVLPMLAMCQHLQQQWNIKSGHEYRSPGLLSQLGEAEPFNWQLLFCEYTVSPGSAVTGRSQTPVSTA